jgi:hypothetical protein
MFFQTLQRRRCDVFVDSPKARRLPCRHGEIRHFLEISLDSPTGIVRDAAAHISALARSQRLHGLGHRNTRKSLSAMADSADV